jgi:hypothetical protein
MSAPTENRESTLPIRWVLRVLIAVALVYTCHRAIVLRIEYCDGYEYQTNARAILGDPFYYDALRPPLITLTQLPAMLLARRSAPGSLVREIAPHCVAAVMSVLSVIAIFVLFRRVFSPDLALLGTVLFVGGRYFVRYAAHVMADVASAGFAAATVAAYLAARERRTMATYGLLGVSLGAAVLAKFPAAALGPVLLVTELGLALRARRLQPWRWGGLLLAGAVAGAVILAAQAVIYTTLHGRGAMQALLADFGPARMRGIHGQASFSPSWRASRGGTGAHGPRHALGPTLAVACVGSRSPAGREDRDLPFIFWLVVVGSGIVFGIGGHNEARYLLPVVPAILYFALRAVEAAAGSVRPRWRRGALATGSAVLLLGTLAGGVRQAWHDRDPIFFSDAGRRSAVRLLASRRGNGRLLWFGALHGLHPRDATMMPEDEYFDVFHFPYYAVQHFVDEPVIRLGPGSIPVPDLPLSPLLLDGDAILRTTDKLYSTATLPADGVPPMEVWRLDRMTVVRDGRGFVSQNPRVRFVVDVVGDQRTIRSERDLGRWSVRGWTAGRARPLADVTLRAGAAVPLGPGSADGDFDSLTLFRIEREVIEVRCLCRGHRREGDSRQA